MFEVQWIILQNHYYKFTAESASERILKIEKHLVQIQPKIYWQIFSGHGVYMAA